MKIFCVTNSLYGGFGYSTVGRNIAKRFRASGIDFVNLGQQTVGDLVRDSEGTANLPIRYDAFGQDSCSDYLDAYDPDLVITMFDIWVNQGKIVADAILKRELPWLCHVTISHFPTIADIINRAVESTYCIAPSKFNYNVLMQSGVRNAIYIPHGVDTNIYKPMDKEKIKESFGLKGKFVFLCVARGRWPQKNLFSLLQAYQGFLQKYPNAARDTHLIMAVDTGEEQSPMLFSQRDAFGLRNNVDFIKCAFDDKLDLRFVRESEKKAFYLNANYRVHEPEMARLYNLADTLVITSIGESFSLPSLEAEACGTPVIFPAHSTGPELVGDAKAGLLCPIAETSPAPQLHQMDFFSISNMVECMFRMWTDFELHKVFSENAVNNAKEYDWEKVFPLWKDAANKALEAYQTVDYHRGRWGL